MTKEDFALYLEETAAEIRAFKLSKEYIYDVNDSLQKNLKDFTTISLENLRSKLIKR